MKKKICRNCDKEKKLSAFYGRQAICKKCHIKNVNYKNEATFICCRCKKNCKVIIPVDDDKAIEGNNKIQVKNSFCCRKCAIKDRKNCLSCESKFWATKTSKYCNKCSRNKVAKIIEVREGLKCLTIGI